MEEEPGVQVWLPCANGVMFPQFLSLVGHGSQCLRGMGVSVCWTVSLKMVYIFKLAFLQKDLPKMLADS